MGFKMPECCDGGRERVQAGRWREGLLVRQCSCCVTSPHRLRKDLSYWSPTSEVIGLGIGMTAGL